MEPETKEHERSIFVFVENVRSIMKEMGIKNIPALHEKTGIEISTLERLLYRKAMHIDKQDELARGLGRSSAVEIYAYKPQPNEEPGEMDLKMIQQMLLNIQTTMNDFNKRVATLEETLPLLVRGRGQKS